jgi:hypothetical protein
VGFTCTRRNVRTPNRNTAKQATYLGKDQCSNRGRWRMRFLRASVLERVTGNLSPSKAQDFEMAGSDFFTDRQLQLPVAVAGAILAGELDVQRAAELGILEDEVEDQHKQGSLRQRRAPSMGACQHSARQLAARGGALTFPRT